jgi:hypothetical protein
MIERMRQAHLGKKASEGTRQKMRASSTRHWFGKQRPDISGPRSNLWRGGITEAHRYIRTSSAYVRWREAVFARDNYTCVECGDDRGGNLEADHIKPFAYFPELRFDVSNGRTLCRACHKETPTWGNKIRDNKGRFARCGYITGIEEALGVPGTTLISTFLS